MMRGLIALCLILLPTLAVGQVAKVSSGDHADFTRVVVQYAKAAAWQMGRTGDGYELRLPEGPVQYDLSKAFNVIGKNRLAGLWADPDTGALHFGIACACYAIPFEFRPGTVVVDIRDGPPPKGSSFELPIDGGIAGDLTPRPTIRPKTRPQTGPRPSYDWTTAALSGISGRNDLPSSALGLSSGNPAGVLLELEPLRQSLIEQLSRGATAGIVDMAKPGGETGSSADSGNAAVELRLGETPNLIFRQKGESTAPMTAEGRECIPNDKLDIASWSIAPPKPEAAVSAHGAVAVEGAPAEGGHGAPATTEAPPGEPILAEIPIAEQFALAMVGLTGEFDRPDPEAVERAIRFDLFIGFGAEARALQAAFPTEQPDAPIWLSMARILDGLPDPAPAFAGMESLRYRSSPLGRSGGPQGVEHRSGAKGGHLAQLFGATEPFA